jgi:hypothetical protein
MHVLVPGLNHHRKGAALPDSTAVCTQASLLASPALSSSNLRCRHSFTCVCVSGWGSEGWQLCALCWHKANDQHPQPALLMSDHLVLLRRQLPLLVLLALLLGR